MENNLYECQISFIYEAVNPVDAARQFIANIQSNPNWFVSVHKTNDVNKKYIVDTDTGEIE